VAYLAIGPEPEKLRGKSRMFQERVPREGVAKSRMFQERWGKK
jgi:hypothetical protein